MVHTSKKSRKLFMWGNYILIAAMLVLAGGLVWIAVRNSNALFPMSVYTDVNEVLVARFALPTTILLIAGVIVSAVMHAYYVLHKEAWRTYYRLIEDTNNKAFDHRMARHVNWMRWCVYAVSQTLLVLVVARYAGVINLFVLIGIVILHVHLQRSGYLMEVLNAYAEKTETVNFLPFVFGMLSWLAIWGTILVHYFILATAVSLPLWRHIMIVGAAVVSVVFGVCVLSRYMRVADMWRNNYTVAMVYIISEMAFAAIIVVPVIIGGFLI